ncbi:hypothetical protein [Epilithonimonas xixisoli]|uniref:Uncharacterized protein n=1 Tax=Epilithonimonas xixisoli TaxID=1476462 RepID=A0A4R8IAJ0_9FLAO|nr:hypothetical protein [Epilithonimonas xixisoli]TDX86674.1 hypothetical protein B0I22_0816 [Epilithonimonas xixisoli]
MNFNFFKRKLITVAGFEKEDFDNLRNIYSGTYKNKKYRYIDISIFFTKKRTENITLKKINNFIVDIERIENNIENIIISSYSDSNSVINEFANLLFSEIPQEKITELGIDFTKENISKKVILENVEMHPNQTKYFARFNYSFFKEINRYSLSFFVNEKGIVLEKKINNEFEDFYNEVIKLAKDSAEHWEYIHSPDFEKWINNFNKIKTENFSKEILNWKEEIHYKIADIILFSDNKYLNINTLYTHLFILTKNKEDSEYLFENLFSCLYHLEDTDKSLELLFKVKEKLLLEFNFNENNKEISEINNLIEKYQTPSTNS